MFSRGRPRPCLAPAMPICNPVDLKSMIKKGERLLGLDVGTKTIGMALSDATLLVASPFDTIRRTRFRDDVQRLAAEIEKHGGGGIVVGFPIGMDGNENPRTPGVPQ